MWKLPSNASTKNGIRLVILTLKLEKYELGRKPDFILAGSPPLSQPWFTALL